MADTEQNRRNRPNGINMAEQAKNTGMVKFGGISRGAAERSRKQVKSGSANFYKFKMGTNLVRFLPPSEGEEVPWVIVYQHYLRNWGGGKRALIFNCPLKAGEGPCPACEEEERLASTGNAADKKASEDYRPRPRVFANIIDRKDEEAGVQIAAFGSMILDQLCELIEDEEVYGADFTHPFEGDDIAIKKGEDSGRTTYKVNIRTGSHDRLAKTEEQMVKWIETAPNLGRYTEILSYEQIVEAGQALEEESQGTSRRRASAKRQVAEPSSSSFGARALESAATDDEGEKDDVDY
jgi:hypothetical protein